MSLPRTPRPRSFVAALLLSGCWTSSEPTGQPDSTSCDPRALAVRASADAEDCGHVPIGASAAPAWACARSAFASGRAFRVSEEFFGIDSKLMVATVGKADRSVLMFTRDGEPGDGAVPVVARISCSLGDLVSDGRDGIVKVGCRGAAESVKICP
jgi:hypothetical protein